MHIVCTNARQPIIDRPLQQAIYVRLDGVVREAEQVSGLRPWGPGSGSLHEWDALMNSLFTITRTFFRPRVR